MTNWPRAGPRLRPQCRSARAGAAAQSQGTEGRGRVSAEPRCGGGGKTPDAGWSRLAAAGTVIGDYRVGEQIGAGGMEVVYEGQDLHLGRRARTTIRISSRSSTRMPPRASTTSRWSFVEGQTLRQIIRERKPLDSQKMLDWIGQTAAVSGAAHEAGIVHTRVPDSARSSPTFSARAGPLLFIRTARPPSDPRE
jgi:hypothetical protein